VIGTTRVRRRSRRRRGASAPESPLAVCEQLRAAGARCASYPRFAGRMPRSRCARSNECGSAPIVCLAAREISGVGTDVSVHRDGRSAEGNETREYARVAGGRPIGSAGFRAGRRDGVRVLKRCGGLAIAALSASPGQRRTGLVTDGRVALVAYVNSVGSSSARSASNASSASSQAA
jgi:hypothetical protein